jgi:hypothetical protein
MQLAFENQTAYLFILSVYKLLLSKCQNVRSMMLLVMEGLSKLLFNLEWAREKWEHCNQRVLDGKSK